MSWVWELSEVWAAMILVLGGALAYWNQKRLEHEPHLLEMRRALYQEYLASLVALGAERSRPSPNDQAVAGLVQQVQSNAAKTAMLASKDVLKPLAKFEWQRNTSSLDQTGESASRLLQAMRKEVFDQDHVDADLMLKAFPIQFKTPPAKSTGSD